MNRLIRSTLLLVTVLLLGGGAAVAETSEKPASPAETRVSADVTMGEIQALFQSFADQAGLELRSDQGIQGKISFRTKNQKLADALDLICKTFKCVWKVEDEALVIDIKK